MVRSLIISLFILAVSVAPAAAAEAGKKEPAAKKKPAAAEPRKLATEKDRISYSAGYDMGMKIKDSGVEVDADLVAQGVRDVLKGGTTLMTRQEVGDTIMAYRIAKRNELAERNQKEGKAFLEENRKKEGVVVLPSGLQYKVLKDGTGKSPRATDIVTVHYRGTLTNGDEFDSSLKRDQPATFPLNQVIKGWTEGLQLMKEGARWQFTVPGELAYGERGMPGSSIGPHAVLVFEVELISVAPAPEPAPGAAK
jgi:FKBP-type peptidyl-prolyl cis-trans isomerase